MVACTSEVVEGSSRKPYLFDFDKKVYKELDKITDFSQIFLKNDLKKNEETKRFTIVYVDTEFGVARMYLKPSQEV